MLDSLRRPAVPSKRATGSLKHIESFIQQAPETESYSRRTGTQLGFAATEPNVGDFLVKLKPDRSRSVEEIESDLRRKIREAEPSIDIEFVGIVADLVGDLVSSPEPIEIKIFHPRDEAFKQAAERITDWLPKIKGVVDINNRTVVIGPAVNFVVDPARAARAGFRRARRGQHRANHGRRPGSGEHDPQ